MQSTNPTTGERLEDRQQLSLSAAKAAAQRADGAAQEWGQQPIASREALVRRVAALLREQSEALARLMAVEMGKPLGEGRAEIEKCASVCDYYAQSAAQFLTAEEIETEASTSSVSFEPLGVVLAVMPWNFPFWQVFRFLAPALMAGNSALLKHASNVQGCAEAIERMVSEAGGPDGLLINLFLNNEDTTALIEDPAIRAVTLTGSTRAGRAVAAAAGQALKKTVLELGGSDPYLILGDANVEAAAETCVKSRLINNGQSCIAAKRFVVVKRHEARFTQLVVEGMKSKRIGDPLDPNTQLGPMARSDLRDDLHQQVTTSVERGARLLLGGQVPAKPGAWYPPTVLGGVTPRMPAYDEELFGPVACVIVGEDDDDAVRIANDSPFGLGSAVFSQNLPHARQVAARIRAGACFINDFVRSDPRLPFGGIKESGYGRELSSFGIREFVNAKTMYVR